MGAFGLYGFEYWDDDDHYVREPFLFTWYPEGLSTREFARAGNALGVVLLATPPATRHDLTASEALYGYKGICGVLGMGTSSCTLVDSFHDCPFTEDPTGASPCRQRVCAGTQLRDRGIRPECCAYIADYCQSNPTTAGCHEQALRKYLEECQDPLEKAVPQDDRMEIYSECSESCRNPCGMVSEDGPIFGPNVVRALTTGNTSVSPELSVSMRCLAVERANSAKRRLRTHSLAETSVTMGVSSLRHVCVLCWTK